MHQPRRELYKKHAIIMTVATGYNFSEIPRPQLKYKIWNMSQLLLLSCSKNRGVIVWGGDIIIEGWHETIIPFLNQ